MKVCFTPSRRLLLSLLFFREATILSSPCRGLSQTRRDSDGLLPFGLAVPSVGSFVTCDRKDRVAGKLGHGLDVWFGVSYPFRKREGLSHRKSRTDREGRFCPAEPLDDSGINPPSQGQLCVVSKKGSSFLFVRLVYRLNFSEVGVGGVSVATIIIVVTLTVFSVRLWIFGFYQWCASRQQARNRR